jgi:hypothetical protein
VQTHAGKSVSAVRLCWGAEVKTHGEKRNGTVAVSKSGSGALHNSSQRWRQGDGLGGVDLLVAHDVRDAPNG